MGEKLTGLIRKMISGVAELSSETTSVIGLYQPKTPENLNKCSEEKAEE